MSVQESKHKIEAHARVAVGAVVIGVFGYTAGILFAKKSGKEMRQDIINGVQQYRTHVCTKKLERE